MCSHPEHRVEVLPDGQIDETHVFLIEDLSKLDFHEVLTAETRTALIQKYFPEVVPNG
ncbi:hypothetical protein RGQ21_67580 [Kitasatospora aureofaciens]|nr:hypothetical protein RGQ21_67580 [Kitasatospora aureofaciens]